MNHTFCGSRAHIGLFEFTRTSVSGHHGRTEEVLEIGATLAGSSDENLGLVSGMSALPLTALGHVSLGKATPLYFQKVFPFFAFPEKVTYPKRVRCDLIKSCPVNVYCH